MNARELLICRQLMQQYGDDIQSIQQCISFAKALYDGTLRRWIRKRKRGIYHKPPEIVGRWPSRKLTPKERRRQWLCGKVMSEAEQVRLYDMIYEEVIGDGCDDDARVRQGQ